MAYIYRHIRLDKNEPFYIGIGSDSGYRAKDSKKRNKIWKGIVSKTEYEVEILLDDITWEQACEKEIEFIQLYGRICNGSGCLANLSLGGEGYLDPSAEVREKLSKSKLGSKNPMFGKKPTKEHLDRLKKALTGRLVSLETREKIAKTQQGKPRNSEEFKKYLSEINSGKNHPQYGKARSSSTKKKISEKRKGIVFSEEHKKKLSEARKLYYVNKNTLKNADI